MEAVPVEILAKDVACTLEDAEVPGRISEWKALLALTTERARGQETVTLRFAAAPGLAARIADLAQRELECCAFFEFTVRIVGDVVELEVRAPSDAAPLLDAFLS